MELAFRMQTEAGGLGDPLNPDQLRPAFNDEFRQVQRGKALERLAFCDNHYLLAIDGTGYFSSPTIHCESCLEKQNRTTGEITDSQPRAIRR